MLPLAVFVEKDVSIVTQLVSLLALLAPWSSLLKISSPSREVEYPPAQPAARRVQIHGITTIEHVIVPVVRSFGFTRSATVG